MYLSYESGHLGSKSNNHRGCSKIIGIVRKKLDCVRIKFYLA
jgi:hypothetical protein